MAILTTQPGLMDQALPAAQQPVQEYVSTFDAFLALFNDYVLVLAVAFLITVCATPIMRRLAIANGVIDHPNDPRKAHKIPVAYMGGVAVYFGLLGGIFVALLGHPHLDRLPTWLYACHDADQAGVPWAIMIGMSAIMITGLIDDVVGLDPRLKIVGQLIAAAALAIEDFGVLVAEGVIMPLAHALDFPMITGETIAFGFANVPAAGAEDAVRETLMLFIPLGESGGIPIDFVYWIGTAIIAIGVLGACNASNLIDGLDGLLSGVTAIQAGFLLLIALGLAATNDGANDATRITLCMALLGACLGFLPHNFNPATIFLGDCGSLLLGYFSITIILSLGDTGRTELVIAGMIIYAIPVIDTILAIVRRKMSGKPMSAPDDQHLHHMLKRRLGVKRAVFALYALGATFGVLGVWLSTGPIRVIFTAAMIVFGFVAVAAFKNARMAMIEQQAKAYETPKKPSP